MCLPSGVCACVYAEESADESKGVFKTEKDARRERVSKTNLSV